jgi:hypothetical protein
MRIRFSIGVANGDQDRDRLEQSRSGAGAGSAPADPARRPAGWPAPTERSDDETELGHPAWAW